MRKLLALSAVFASPALAQTPAGVINAPIYATGYISQVGGTNVTTNIPPQPNHPTNLSIYTTSAISGTWTIKLPNPAFEGQVLSFNCGAAANAIAIVSSDGSSIDSNLPTSCAANGGFVAQFDLRSNIWRSLGSGYSANFRPFTGVISQWPWQLNTDGTWTLKQPTYDDIASGKITIGGASVVGPVSVKGYAGAPTIGFFSNLGGSDSSASWFTLRDGFTGTRGGTGLAGNGNGPVINFQSWSRSSGGQIVDAVQINAGLENAAPGAECSDIDFNGYVNGTGYTGMFAIDACGGGLTSQPTIFPGGDLSWNLGWSTRRFLDGYFGGTLSTATLAVSNNVFLSGAVVSGSWNGSVIGATYGGTGVNNGSKTITLGASLTTTGTGTPTLAFPSSDFTYTFPSSSSTLATVAGSLQVANNLSDLANAATARTNLGVTATGTDTTYAYRANNLSDLASAATARTNLGLGTAATQNTGTSGATVPLLSTANTWGDAQNFPSGTVLNGNSFLAIANITALTGNSAAPTVSACGTGSPAMSSDATTLSGMVTTGSGAATSCTISWASARSVKPQCVVSSETGATITGYTPSTASLIITFSSASSQRFTYICAGP